MAQSPDNAGPPEGVVAELARDDVEPKSFYTKQAKAGPLIAT
jgi:hypothetical protein